MIERTIVKIDTGVRHKIIPGQGFPPLMEDTRDNNLANIKVGDNEIVYVKAIAGPYVGTDGLHMMVLPDFKNGKEIFEVSDISPTHLSKALEVAGALAHHSFEEVGVQEVNVGIHTAKDEWVKTPKQRIKNFKNLHIHVEAPFYDNKPGITSEELRRNLEYFGKTPEPFEEIGYQILQNEILPKLRKHGIKVDELFKESEDKFGRFRLELKNGNETFKSPELAAFIQQLDIEGQKSYNELAMCFFEVKEGGFKVDEGQYKRYKLLPPNERRLKIDEYIQKREWLSSGSKGGLRLFTAMAQNAEEVIDREIVKILGQQPSDLEGRKTYEEKVNALTPKIANRFMAYRGLSYATLFSGIKESNDKIKWTLGIRPSVFLIEGFVEMADTYGIIVKHQDRPYSEGELARVQSRERKVILNVQNDIPNLKNGPGLENGV